MRINRVAIDTQVAKALGVDVRWLRREARSGRLPSVRAGKVFLFDIDAVESALLERARGNAQHTSDPALAKPEGGSAL